MVRAMAVADHGRWGFDAQVGADFLAGDLHLPALQVGGEDGVGAPVGIGAEQCLGVPAPARVAQEQPAQGNGGLARVVPEGRAGGDLEMPLSTVGPALGQGGQTVAGSVRTVCREGSRGPTTRGCPI